MAWLLNRLRKNLKAMNLRYFGFFLYLFLISANMAHGQIISTDKVDYMPGETVILTGKGWNPFEKVRFYLEEFPNRHLNKDTTLYANALGQFSEPFYLVQNSDLGVTFQLSAQGGYSSRVVTTTFNDASGDYTLDFSAYDPAIYDRIMYDPQNNYPSGRIVSPLGNTNHSQTIESLQPPFLGLGQIVAFEYQIRVDANGACSNDQIRINGEFLSVTTNGHPFGFDKNAGLIAAFVDAGTDPGLIDNGTSASVSNFSWLLNGNTIETTVDITGLDPGDEIIVELWLVLQNYVPETLGGNVKTRLSGASLIGSCETQKTSINTGNQEIPLLQVGDFLTADVNMNVSKTDAQDPIAIGDNITYTLTISNDGNAVANAIKIIDNLDANTAYVPGSLMINDNTGASWTLSQQNNSLLFTTSYMDMGEVASLTYQVEIINSSGFTGTGGDQCNGSEDVCNSVSVTSIGTDSDPTNNIDSEATGVSSGGGNNNAQCPVQGVSFQSCASGALASDIMDSWNGAWIDYDNDNDEDLFIANKNKNQAGKLYRNNGDGSFTSVTNTAISNILGPTTGGSWADYNNDNFIDGFLTNATQVSSSLLKGASGGQFNKITNSDIYASPEYFHGAAWADYDNDGYVDLVLTNFFPTRFHHLYHNDGDGTFSRMQNSPISLESQRAMAPIWGDYNNDCLPDLFIPNGNNQGNSLFKNLGNGQFEKITSGAIVTDKFNSVGAAWGDYDNDGWLDLVVANSSNQVNQLYRNNRNGTFTRINSGVFATDKGNSHGISWADVDNDGDLDLYVTNDSEEKKLYYNDNGTFINSVSLLNQNYGSSFGHSWADFNKDGFLDVAVFTHGNEVNHLFCNQGNANHWSNILLKGTNSNRSAIGARIRVKSDGKWQTREVQAQSGFGSPNSLRQHFGLACATSIDSIVIKWPSGYTQYETNIPADQFITISEQNASLVQGTAYHDENGNCVMDEGESPIAHAQFTLSPSGMRISTDSEGNYQFYIESGSYNYNLDSDYWNLNCSGSLTVGSDINTVYTKNLGLSTGSTNYDLCVSYGSTAWRRGFTNTSDIYIANIGTSDATNVTLTVTYPPEVIIESASIPWDSQSGNTYTWNISLLEMGSEMYIQLTDYVTLESSVGDVYPVSINLTSEGTDLNPANNTFSESNEIVGAIDPNDILVSPGGDGEQGYINKNQSLIYTIRFQNVGTWWATNVFIKNQLSEMLDLNSFRVVSASHSYNYSLDSTGHFSVNFLNINLPDSNRNEPESHGFIKYEIKAKPTLLGGEVILNNAAIVFDFEDPIITNTTLHTIKYTENPPQLQLLLFPNPARGEVSARLIRQDLAYEVADEIQSISIFDLQGRLVNSTKGEISQEISLNLQGLMTGMYVVKAKSRTGAIVSARILVE
ncbi:hypothetical protein PEDI_18300 [Persicobacter diffluens]|uniref:ASPIC/UnbV domain-containing protein n=2 Tax=Persicobacter diffluens TaxID=981 RepID=A0AAN4VYH3_9BACT|nr:hypothetical protein PEDI_18300 [Persicobacter diffluens]